jgi:hypothetical protein
MNSFFQHWTRSVVETLKQRHTNSRPDYPREGQAHMIIRLLKQVKAGLPPGTQVRVLADRGIGTSPLLMRGIMALERTFLFRVTKQSKIIFPSGEAVCFYDQVTAPGHMYHASGRVFKKRGRIPAQVRVLWEHHAQDRWALVTNAPLSGENTPSGCRLNRCFVPQVTRLAGGKRVYDRPTTHSTAVASLGGGLRLDAVGGYGSAVERWERRSQNAVLTARMYASGEGI